MAPVLRGHGFRGSGLRWRRRKGELADLVEFQFSRHSLPDTPSFTANLGVFCQDAYRLVWGKAALYSKIHAVDCFPSERLGRLRSIRQGRGARDFWWEPSISEPPSAVLESLVESIERDAMPWFLPLVDVPDLIRMAQQKKQYGIFEIMQCAALLALAGETASAVDLLERANKRPSVHWTKQIEEMKHRITGSEPPGDRASDDA